MSEAKKRNPDIKLYGLPWAFPAWVGNGTGNPYAYPNMTADYVVKWVDGAKTVYNLDIDYVVCFLLISILWGNSVFSLIISFLFFGV